MQSAHWPRPRWRANRARRKCRAARTQLFSSLAWAPSSHLHQRQVRTQTSCFQFVLMCLTFGWISVIQEWLCNMCDVPPQCPHILHSTASTPRASPSPTLMGPFTPYSGLLIYQVGTTFTTHPFSAFGNLSELIAFRCKTLWHPVKYFFTREEEITVLLMGTVGLCQDPAPTP